MIDLDGMKHIELEMMKEIHAFCQAHGITYSLGYGTLLGAVRHKGFIPWDDDIDILMPRPDYDAFRHSFQSGDYQVVSSSDSGYFYPYAKVYDKRTYLQEDLRYTYPDMGVFIDIFPVDGLPDEYDQQVRLYKKQKFLYKLHMSMKYRFSREWNASKNLLLLLARMIALFFPIGKVIKKLEQNYLLFAYEEKPQVAVMLGEVKLVPISRSSFESLTLLEFEDTQFYAIAQYESYLSGLYGDYLQLPPLAQQASEHRYTVGWKQEK
ncbi:LicD family protein [Sphaerochaeta sp. PS]|uniref:LicD family protein n=1 Tax=Sphaerochaeta sp. PS TaxID=3076336 RepID=UPI0028A42BF5|nr:LicD family protein [Sphaerochaeta sp. PS]MDT4762166.1 LicD family protein [Sphaerochaeta sp. PS]